MTDRQMDTDNYRAGHLASCKTLIIITSENECWRTIAETSHLLLKNMLFRPKKKILCVYFHMLKKIRVGRSEIFFF